MDREVPTGLREFESLDEFVSAAHAGKAEGLPTGAHSALDLHALGSMSRSFAA